MKSGRRALLALLLGLSCAWPDTSVPIGDLLDAPTSLAVSGRTLLLFADMSRDFMPGANPPEGSDLGLYVQVWSADSLPVLLEADRAWVIRRSSRQAWETELWRINDWNPCGFVRGSAGGGPKWETGIRCDVVVRLRDTACNTWLLRAPDVEIVMTL
ncbi:MAG: hypothetical protein R6X12_08815 [bacterium]